MPRQWTDSRAALNLTREMDFLRDLMHRPEGVVFPEGSEFEYKFLTEYNPLFNAFGGLTSILDDPDDFNPANEFDELAFRAAFDLWSDLANVTFREGGGDIEIAYGYSGRAVESDPGFGFDNGIWVNDNGYLSNTNFFSFAQEGWFTSFLHEVGHAIGLAHPGHYNGDADFDDDALYYQDTDQYTLMSYFQEDENGSGVDYEDSEPNTPMLHDVLAIQALYGPNLLTRTGDNVYGFAASGDGMRDAFDFTKNTTPVVTIWDAAGEDTLNLSGSTASQRIDLSPGSYSDAMGMAKNLAIAFGTEIENAVGGAGDDVLIGSDVDNMLNGGDGNDELWGRLGNDDLFGNTGADLVVGGLGRDQIFGGEGDDVLFGGDRLQPGGQAPVPDAAFKPVDYISDAFSTSGWYSFNVRQMYFGNFEGDTDAEFIGLLRHNNAHNHDVVEAHIRAPDNLSFVKLERDTFVNASKQNHTPREVGDVNGDGYDDLVAFWSDGRVWVALANGDGTFADPNLVMTGEFGRDQGWTTQSRFPRKIADVDGDGNADLVAFGRSAVYVARGQDDGTFADRMVAHTDFRDGHGGWRDQFDTPRTIGDVNGDGRADIVGFKGTGVHVAFGKADGTFGTPIITRDFGKEDVLGRTISFGNSDHFPRHLGDINGDGVDDIVVFTHERGSETALNRLQESILPGDAQSEQVLVAFGIGDGTFHALKSIDVPGLPENGRSDDFDWLRFDVVDVNGDGRDDLAGFSYRKGVWVAYSQGDGADLLIGGEGNDTLIGGDGEDTARFSGGYEDYIIERGDSGRITVLDTRDDSPDGRDVLEEIERLEFDDGNLLIGSDGVFRFIDSSGTARPVPTDSSHFDDMYLRPGEWQSLGAALKLSAVEVSDGTTFDIRTLDDRVSLRQHEDAVNVFNGLTFSELQQIEFSGPAEANIAARIWVRVAGEYSQGAWQSVEVTTRGPDYNFRVNGTSEDDNLIGGDGIDKLYGLGGDDSLDGGYYNDRLDGGDGKDTLDGGSGDDVLHAGAGDDVAIGADGADRIHGQDGNDQLRGGDGDDRIWGQSGNDNIEGGNGDDKVFGGDDGDQIDGGNGHDWLYGQLGKDHLIGGNGNDVLIGGQGRDKLQGGRGDDRIQGGEGNDALSGAAGNDQLWGGAGEDIFEFRRNFGHDTVEDYEVGVDKVNFRGARLEIEDLQLRQVGEDTEISWGTGVSETLCMRLSPCSFDGSFIEPFWVQNSELITCGNPFSDSPA